MKRKQLSQMGRFQLKSQVQVRQSSVVENQKADMRNIHNGDIQSRTRYKNEQQKQFVGRTEVKFSIPRQSDENH